MDIVQLIARLLLACVFAVAAIGKLTDRTGTARAITDFGLPASLARPLSYVLPLAEILVALLLLPTATAWWGGVGALTLLLAFTVVIGGNLARGRKPDCHCFGQLHSAPAGWTTLLRNVFFASCAAFVLWSGRGQAGLSVAGWADGLTVGQLAAVISTLLLAVALAAAAWIIFHLLRQHGRLLLRIDIIEARLNAGGVAPGLMIDHAQPGLPVGSRAPSFELPLLSGERLTLDDLSEDAAPVLLVFSDPDCVPCNALLPELAGWERQHAGKLTVVVVSRGALKANRAKTDAYGLKKVLLQQDREVAEKYQVQATPGGVLVMADGLIGSNVATGPQAIAALVARATGTELPTSLPVVAGNGHHHRGVHVAQSAAMKHGEPPPPLRFPDLTGRPIGLHEFEGRNTLVLFWNPGCGFCNQMLPELKAWEDGRGGSAPELLVISTGSVEVNRAMGLRSTVVLDQSFSAGRAFGVQGTPSAVLIDAGGQVASDVVIGAPAILALAGAR